jgi:hypothetical protein
MIGESANPAATQEVVVLTGVVVVVIILAVIGFLWMLSR